MYTIETDDNRVHKYEGDKLFWVLNDRCIIVSVEIPEPIKATGADGKEIEITSQPIAVFPCEHVRYIKVSPDESKRSNLIAQPGFRTPPGLLRPS